MMRRAGAATAWFLGTMCLLAHTSWAADSLRLTLARGPGPGEVSLEWDGGGGLYAVSRAGAAELVGDPGAHLANTGASSWLDIGIPPVRCYRVVETTCGNGQVDFGEECDDGAHSSGDGCSDRCTREARANAAIPDRGLPRPRSPDRSRSTPRCSSGSTSRARIRAPTPSSATRSFPIRPVRGRSQFLPRRGASDSTSMVRTVITSGAPPRPSWTTGERASRGLGGRESTPATMTKRSSASGRYPSSSASTSSGTTRQRVSSNGADQRARSGTTPGPGPSACASAPSSSSDSRRRSPGPSAPTTPASTTIFTARSTPWGSGSARSPKRRASFSGTTATASSTRSRDPALNNHPRGLFS